MVRRLMVGLHRWKVLPWSVLVNLLVGKGKAGHPAQGRSISLWRDSSQEEQP